MSVQEKYNSSLEFSGGMKISTKGLTVPMGSKACKVSQKTVDPKGNHSTPMMDYFSHKLSNFTFGDVLYNICT